MGTLAAGFNLEKDLDEFYPEFVSAIGEHLKRVRGWRNQLMQSRKGDFEGILLVDKPKGITSHGAVSRLRRKLNMKRIGHAGTLDPMATGLLIMLIGKATKASQYLISLDKTYEGTIRLGIETDSQDADGEVVAEKPVPDGLSEETVRAEMDGF